MEAGWDGRTVRIPYHKYKALPLLLVNLLELGKQSYGMVLGTQTAEAVFPALDIIRRAGPPEGYHEKLYDIISWYLGSRIWHVREIAARTLCSLLLTSTWLQSIEKLIGNSGDSSNKLHGALLTIKFLLERLIQVMPDQLSGRFYLCALAGTMLTVNRGEYQCPLRITERFISLEPLPAHMHGGPSRIPRHSKLYGKDFQNPNQWFNPRLRQTDGTARRDPSTSCPAEHQKGRNSRATSVENNKWGWKRYLEPGVENGPGD